MDLYFTARTACRQQGLLFGGWMDDKELSARKQHGYGFANVPDGFFVTSNAALDRDDPFFFEIDLGHTSIRSERGHRDWVNKITGYETYLGGAYARDFEGLPDPLVLILTDAEERLANLIEEAVLPAGTRARYWVTTFPRLREQGFWGPIWQVDQDPLPRTLLAWCTRATG